MDLHVQSLLFYNFINATAYHLADTGFHLLQLKSSMARLVSFFASYPDTPIS